MIPLLPLRRALAPLLFVAGCASGALPEARPSAEGAAAAAPAGGALGLAARITVLRPKPGLDDKFEEGYRRHLEWHRQNKDPWAWLGWSVITGDRLGWFVDGTFGHPWGELDRPVAPAQDRADNDRNVEPYADFMSSSVYALRADLSRGEPERVLGSPFVDLASFDLVPGAEAPFAEALAALGHDGRGPARASLCFELVSGGELPGLLCLFAREGWAELGRRGRGEADAAAGRRAAAAFRASVRRERVETLRLRPDLGYTP